MMREKRLNNNWIFAIVSLGLLAFLLVAVHDVQTAQGIGLYLSMLAGAPDRTMFDLAVDVVAILGAALLVGLPGLILKHKEAASYLRFLVTFLAFMPVLGLDYLVHLLTGKVEIGLRPALLEGEILLAFLEGTEFSVSLLQMVVPMFVLLLAMLLMGERNTEGGRSEVDVQGTPVKRWYLVVLIVGAVAELGVFLIPGLAELLGFVMTYLILLVMFDMWERLIVIYPLLGKWGWILFGGLGLRGIYLLLDLMSAYKLQ